MDEDVREFARAFSVFMTRMSEAASADRTSMLKDLLDQHLGTDCEGLPIVREGFAPYDHVNVQVALDSYLSIAERAHRLIGLTGQSRHHGSLSDIIQMATQHVGFVRIGSVDLVELALSPDESKACVNFGIYLIEASQTRLAVLVRGADPRRGNEELSIEVLTPEAEDARTFLREIRHLIVERNVFRRQIITFGVSRMGYAGAGPIVFLRRPVVARDEVVLSADAMEKIERQIQAIARHAERLRASGQHVKRGLLLHGPPGNGKTLTVRYLASRMRDHTIVVLTGESLAMIRPACGLARMLQPAMVILEDVDLVAQERTMPGSHGVLFELLNEMDGIGEDADVSFVLTTNRASLLEPALAARPGRVDLAIEIGLPDDAARRRLIDLYGRGLDLRVDDPTAVVTGTHGVAASFIKEMMRRAALIAAEDASGNGRISVSDEHLRASLEELLEGGDALIRALLGGPPAD